jgi:heat shock protein HtpX
MFKSAKTFVLLAALSGILLWAGQMLDAGSGSNTFLILMLFVSLAMNFAAYFYSDKIAIKAARAKPMSEADYPDIYAMVRNLSARAGQPMPKLYMSPSPQLNAFATGRNPDHAAVAVNQGLYEALTAEELEGVLGHELQHVYNRDILIGSVAAMIATTITFLARIAMWGAILGGRDERGGGNAIGQLALVLLAPIAAMLIQASVTRSRESLADKTGAELTGNPLGLARALAKLEAGANDPRRLRMGGTPAETNAAFQHMYISAPFGGRLSMGKLFSTHPPIPERIAALEEMARQKGQLGPGQTIYG